MTFQSTQDECKNKLTANSHRLHITFVWSFFEWTSTSKRPVFLEQGPQLVSAFSASIQAVPPEKELKCDAMSVHLWQVLNLLVQLHQLWLCVLLLFCSCRLMFPPRLNLHLLISSPPTDAVWGGGRYSWGVGSSGHPHSDRAGQGWRRLLSSTKMTRWHSTLSEQQVTGWFTSFTIGHRGEVQRWRIEHHLHSCMNGKWTIYCFVTCETLFGCVISPSGLRNNLL